MRSFERVDWLDNRLWLVSHVLFLDHIALLPSIIIGPFIVSFIPVLLPLTGTASPLS